MTGGELLTKCDQQLNSTKRITAGFFQVGFSCQCFPSFAETNWQWKKICNSFPVEIPRLQVHPRISCQKLAISKAEIQRDTLYQKLESPESTEYQGDGIHHHQFSSPAETSVF